MGPLLVALLVLAAPTEALLPVAGLVQAQGKPARDAVVWIDAQPPAAARAKPRAVLEQRNLSFSVRVLAVEVGTIVEFPNNDRVFHNVFSFHDGKKFDLGLYPVGTMREVVLDKPGLSRIYCNIHPNMSSYIMAVDTPYFAVTDGAGRFTIADVLAGTHAWHAWKPGGDVLNGTVTVAPGAQLSIDLP